MENIMSTTRPELSTESRAPFSNRYSKVHIFMLNIPNVVCTNLLLNEDMLSHEMEIQV